jgi:chloramphenicol 3-O-phosphotransferase
MLETKLMDRQTHALTRAFGYWEEQHREAAHEAHEDYTIALDYEEGVPVKEVARAVGDRLGWRVLDHEIPEAIARELRVPVSLLDSIEERGQAWFLECIAGFVSSGVPTECSYVRHLLRHVHELGEKGCHVLVGHGAAQILPAARTLRVQLVGAWDDRIATLRRRLHVERHEAAQWAEEHQRQHRRFLREHFHKDPAQPGNYDLILNTSHWSVAECAGLILQGLGHKVELAERSH